MADEQLEILRSSIDNLDTVLVLVLAERFRITKAVGEYKARSGLAPADPARENEQVARLRELAASTNLDPSFAESFMRLVFAEVVGNHRQASASP